MTTPSALVLETTVKALALLDRLGLPVAGLVENLRRDLGPTVADRLDTRAVPFLGSIRYDPGYELCLGDRERMATTQFAGDVTLVARALVDGTARRGAVSS